MSTSLIQNELSKYANYVLVYNKDTQTYNHGHPYDTEERRFEFSESSGVPSAHAKQLNDLNSSIGRIVLTTSHQTISASTGSFFVNGHHIITSSNILFPANVSIPPLEVVKFEKASFSRKAVLDTEEKRKFDSTRIEGLTLVYISRNVAIFKLPQPVQDVIPIVPVQKIIKDPVLCYVIGYAGKMTLDEAKMHYEKLSQQEKAANKIPPPTQADIDIFPADKKAVFPGTVSSSGVEEVLHLTTSMYHGCSGAPVFTVDEKGKLQFIAIVYGGSVDQNHNTAVSCIAGEFFKALMTVS